MKNKHYNFRVLGEARLCRMSSEVAGDTPTSNNEQIGEALLPPDGDGSSQGMQDGAKTQMDVRSGNLGKVLEDMGETADASQKTPVDTVPPAGEVKNAPEAKARKPRGNAEMRAKIRAEAAQDAAVAAKEEAAKPEAPAPEAPAPVGPADDSAEKGVTDDQMAQGGEEPQPEAPAPEAPAPVGPADDSAEKKVTDDQMAEGGRADPPENRQVIMAEMQGKTEQLLQAVRDAEAKAEMEGYTPENTQAITAAIDAYITAANSEQGYLRADDLVTNVDRQSTLDTEIAQQRNRREQLGNYPNESKAPNGQPEKGAESGEKTIDQLNTKINQSLDSAKEALSKLPNAKNSPVPETILTGRFEKVTGTQSGNRAREDIVLKCRATAGTLNLISKIGYDATSYNPATGSGDVRRGNQTIEISNHEVTIDLEELVCCDDMPLEEQVRHVEEALEEITTAFSTEADPKKTQQRFDAQVSSGSFITESFQEKPGEESWRTDARGTEELRQLFKDMPKDAQKTVIGRFMEKANVRQDKDGKTFLSTSANMATEFRAVALFAARSINIVERQDENGKPLEMGMQTSPSQISHLLNGIRLRYTQEGGKGEAEGSTSIDGHKISSSETDTPDNKATEVSGAAGGDKVEGAGEKTNDGGRKGVEASKELPPAIQEAKNHFGERYANLSPEKMKAVMAAIESLDPEQARVLMDSYKVLSPKEKEIYDKAGPKIVEELAQLSPNDIRIKIQMIAENDTGKLIKLNKSLSPEGKAVLDKNASQFSQEENDMYDKLHNEQDRLAVERGIVKPNAAPSVSADDQVPAGAPEAVRRVADLRTQMVDVNNKIGEVNQELAPLNGQLQQLKGERAALVAKNEDTADIDQKITQVEQQMKPLLDKRDALKAEAKDIAAQIKDSKGELPENATRADVARRALDDMGDAFKDPNATGGEKLIAAIQAIGAIMALWRSAMGRGEAQPAEVAGSKPTDKPKDNGASKPTDGSEQPTERGAETPEARKGRLRKEVKDSAVNSAQELIAEKKQTLEKQTKGLKDRIDALDGETKGLKGESEGLAKKIAEKKEAASKAKPEERDALQSEIRIAEQHLKSLNDRIAVRESESKQLTEKLNALPAQIEADIKTLEEMRKDLAASKDTMDQFLRGLRELKNPEADAFVAGITIGIDEKNMEITVTATPDAQKKIQELAPGLSFDSAGKLQGNPEEFGKVLVALTQKLKDQPQSPPAAPAAPSSPDASPDIKGEMPKVIEGTLKDTIGVLVGRIERAQKNVDDARKDFDEVKSSWNPFRNGEQAVKAKALAMAESARNVLQAKLDQVKAIPADDPKKQLDALMQIRGELGLPKVPQEFAKDYDTFQKMASEGIGKKDKSTEVDYAALNKELQDIEATLANVEMGLQALDTAAGTAASLVPFGSKVYNLSQLATNVATGNKTPQQAGADFATSYLFGKLGGKVLASAGGKQLIEKYSMKFAEKFFSNPNAIKKFVEITSKKVSDQVLKQVDNAVGIKNSIKGSINAGINKGAQWLNDGGKWLGENGYALWANTIAPSLQDLSVEAQKQFADGMKAFQEIKTGIMTSSATDFAQGYKRNFKDMYGDAVQTATNQIKKIRGLDGAKVDALVTQVTAELEKQFDNAAKTVQDINDKGAGNVLKGFVADLRVVGGDAYEKNIAPMVANLQEGGQKLAAEGMQMLKAIKESTATDFGKGYKEQFAKMYGPRIEQAKDLMVRAGLDKAKVDQFVGDVTASIEKGFDKGVQTVQDINDKGAGNVLKGFVADLRVVGGDAYEQYLQPSVNNMKEGASQLMADGMKMLNEIKTGVMTSTPQDFAKGYKEQFKGLYGPRIEQATNLLVKAGLDKGRVDQFVNAVTAGIEKQFDAGVKTAAEMQQKGVATVLREFSADMGVVAEQGFNDYLKPTIDMMDAKARPHVEVAMRELATLREGALQLLKQNPRQTAEEYVQKVQQMYGPAIESARVQLAQAGITPDNARKFLGATVQSVKDGYQKIAARVKEV